MARTINEILTEANAAQNRLGELYTVITNEVNADANLDGLTSTSKTAEFNLWKYIWSAMAYIQEAIWDERKSEIQSIADSAIPGTEPWFQKELLKFQYGDSLSFDAVTKRYFYAVIDEAKQIIKRCAVISNGGLTQVKVAKESAGLPVPLLGPELSALLSYMRQIQWAGANVATPVSLTSDKINAPLTIYYNGTVDLIALKALVEDAFTNYLKALPFNGEFKITSLLDAIQAVPNVNDVVAGTIEAKLNAGSYGTVNRIYIPGAGYIEKDPGISFAVMLTYVAQ